MGTDDTMNAHAEVEVVHEGRGGYVRVTVGDSSFDYPFDHVADGRFEIQFPAGNRSRTRHEHLAALEELCAREAEKFRVHRR